MSFVEDSGASFNALFSSTLSFQWHVYSTVSLLSLLGSLTVIYYWQMNDWSNHPIVKDLSMYVDREDGDTRSVWRIKASEINNEFRRIDKFTTSLVGWTRVIVTENWIILTSLYGVKFVPQDQATVSVFETEEHDISPESNEMVQYLSLRMKPTIRRELKPFFARILSLEFKDLKESLRCRVYTLPHLSILQTTNEIFLKAFHEQVNKNEKYTYDEEADSCIGCMQKPSGVKLVKNCGSEDANGCKSCNCKPLWCVDCMGRWYASRQDQDHTDTWLSGFATCPMCRARFCMLDISLVQVVR